MKTFIYLIATCFISTGICLATLNSGHIVSGYAAAIGLWAWFLWGCDRRKRKAGQKRRR